jgi:D-hydantoinase
MLRAATRTTTRAVARGARSFSNIHQGINKTGMDKAVLIKGGTIINSDREFKGDVLSIGEHIAQVSDGTPIEKPAGMDVEVIDAHGCYVMPGGIDPQTHMEIPFMGTRGIDDFYSGLAAAQTGGTTMLMDFVIPGKGQRLMEAWESWNDWASKAAGDYSFHVAVTWWDDTVKEDQKTLSQLGVNSFKHFLAYKGAIMADDEILVNSFSNCAELGCMATIHAENGEIISHLQQQIFDSGITGPEGHPASRPPEVEGEATNRAIRIAEMIGIPVYIVHTSSRDAMEAVAAARARGQVAFSEVLSQHLVVDDSMYFHEDWRVAAHHVMSPPFRNKKHQESLWNALTSGTAQTTATDHCSFSTAQKEAGKNVRGSRCRHDRPPWHARCWPGLALHRTAATRMCPCLHTLPLPASALPLPASAPSAPSHSLFSALAACRLPTTRSSARAGLPHHSQRHRRPRGSAVHPVGARRQPGQAHAQPVRRRHLGQRRQDLQHLPAQGRHPGRLRRRRHRVGPRGHSHHLGRHALPEECVLRERPARAPCASALRERPARACLLRP